MEFEMNYDELKYFKGNETGETDLLGDFKIKEIPFDKYVIKIKLTPDNKFIEVIEIGLNKEFLSIKQKCSKRGFHDVEALYRD